MQYATHSFDASAFEQRRIAAAAAASAAARADFEQFSAPATARARANQDLPVVAIVWCGTLRDPPTEPAGPVQSLTFEDVRAEIPEEGITCFALYDLFRSHVASEKDMRAFIAHVQTAAVQDPETGYIFPKLK